MEKMYLKNYGNMLKFANFIAGKKITKKTATGGLLNFKELPTWLQKELQ